MGRHKWADLFLDTFNYNAHATASDALWAGLPVVTKLGKGFAARVAGSLLSAIDMPELITETEQEYESLILDLATNPKRLGAIKLKLAANRLSKPLFNTELFTKHLEDGYQRAYQQYFDGKEPEAIYVPEQVWTATQIATFKAGNKRKTTHSHLFLPKEYSGDPYASVFNHYTEAEVLSFLETGWGIGNVEDLQLSFLYGPEDDQ